MEYKVSSKDFDEIDNWLRTASAIKKLFSKLCSLEKNGLKNSSEYLTYVDYLSIALDVEDKIVKNLTPEKSHAWLNLLISDQYFGRFSQFGQKLPNINIKNRLINTLSEFADLDELEAVLFNNYCMEEPLHEYLDFSKIVQSDIYSFIFEMLSAHIKGSSNSPHSIEMFYALAFTNSVYNRQLVSCNFHIPRNDFCSFSDLAADFYQIDKTTAEIIVSETCEFFLNEVDELLELIDNHYVSRKSKKSLNALIRILSSSVFLLLDSQHIQSFLKYYSSENDSISRNCETILNQAYNDYISQKRNLSKIKI